MNYTDKQLKAVLAKMLPEVCYMNKDGGALYHQPDANGYPVQPLRVLDTELMYLCWLVEETLNWNQRNAFQEKLTKFITKQTTFWLCSMPWQQRVIALAKVKGIEI